MRYEIEGGNLPVLNCFLEPGETIVSQRGAMSWASSNMSMDTSTGGGLKKAVGRLLVGESVFVNEFSPQGGNGMIAFASSFPGSIVPFAITPGNGMIIQKKSFLAMTKGVDLSIHFQKRLGAGLWGGEGFLLQKANGTGTLFAEIDGFCKEITLRPGESILVDTGCLAAMTDNCTFSLELVSGTKNIFFSGEGLFHTKISAPNTGYGKVYLQSMPIQNTAAAIRPYLNIPQGGNRGE